MEMKSVKTRNEREGFNQRKKRNVIFQVINDYFTSTSVHGVKYIGDRNTHIIEKLWWLIAFIASVSVCIVLITRAWTKWNESPVIISFSQTQIPISNIPFPAVTICPFNKIDRKKYHYKEMYLNRSQLTGAEAKKFWDISLVCQFYVNQTGATDQDAIKNIKWVAMQENATIVEAKLNGKKINFTHQITEDGLCFTFNALGQADMFNNKVDSKDLLIENTKRTVSWSYKEGYKNKKDMNLSQIYPMRTKDGVQAGLHLKLKSSLSGRDFACGPPITGYKVSLHNPADIPRVTEQYILAPLKKIITVAVKPKLATTTSGLQDIRPHRRNCFFPHEKTLQFFKVYTQSNCRFECKINITKQHCGCAAYYMPRDNNTKICSTMDCVTDVESGLLQTLDDIQNKNIWTNEEKKYVKEYKIFNKCNCLPSCANIEYDYDTSQADFNWLEGHKCSRTECKVDKLESEKMIEDMEYTYIDIFFKKSLITALHRSELYGETDFIATCGGLLGLFIGFSFLSFLEFIYFFTVRLWCGMNNRNKN